jgi:hypothetical protein
MRKLRRIPDEGRAKDRRHSLQASLCILSVALLSSAQNPQAYAQAPPPLPLTEVDPRIAASCTRWDNSCTSCERNSPTGEILCSSIVARFASWCRPVRVRCKRVDESFRRTCSSWTDFCNVTDEATGQQTNHDCGEAENLVREVICLKWVE